MEEFAPNPPISYRSLEWKDLDKKRFFFYNPLVFMGLRILQHPANVIKTRYQVQQRNSLYASTTSVLVQTLRNEGVAGLYRGFGMSSLMLVVQQVYIVMYEFLRASDRYKSPPSESARNAIAAAVSVLTVQTFANPVDVLSQRLFLQGQLVSNQPMEAPKPPSATATVGPVASGAGATGPSTMASAAATASLKSASNSIPRVLTATEIMTQVYRSHGLLKGFYSGFFISCAQFIPSASLWWWSYPHFREFLLPCLRNFNNNGTANQQWGLEPSAAAGLPASSWMRKAAEVLPAERLAEVLGGACAGATVAVALNPVDIIRTRTQVEGKASLTICKELIAAEGLRGLWKGTSARIAMLTPQGALTIAAYELVKRLSVTEEALARLRAQSALSMQSA